MKSNLTILHLIILILFSSCAFNRTFLKPTKLEDDAKQELLIIQSDTVTVRYLGKNKQPLFIRNGNDTVQFNFTTESVFFKSSSGNRINGWMIKSRTVKPKITVLYFHGNARDLAGTHWSMTKLLDYGFQVFAIDYSGYGLSEGKATRKNVLKDGISALNYLLTRKDIKSTKIVIYGQSLGGNLAPVVAARNESKVDGLVIEGAFTSHKEIGHKFVGFISNILVKEMYSSKDAIRDFHKPVLIIHSKEDNVIPFWMGEKLYKLANEPKEFYSIDGCHICGSRIYAESIAKKINQLLYSHSSKNK